MLRLILKECVVEKLMAVHELDEIGTVLLTVLDRMMGKSTTMME